MKMYQVDAFSHELFKGNPAAVLLLDEWLEDALMQNIALENNLSETSFAKKIDNENYEIRWFSPVKEVQFCGYGTLATSFVIFNDHQQINSITFHVKDMGEFFVERLVGGQISLNLPAQIPQKLEQAPDLLIKALNSEILEVYENPQAYIAVYKDAASILAENPDFNLIKNLGGKRVAITAINDLALAEFKNYDIISRYFTPSMGIDEDPVTGSLHTSLMPLWKEKTGKSEITAYQASSRGGVLYCRLLGNDRVEITGTCRLYMEAILNLNHLKYK
ncbi:phenazine biosynthesis protein PhzF [Acinetobacter sp. Ac_877]|uniref:PhzF family phenazine biosynthesis protein n=1 Tax=Acinetobacter portensis TaxID=1839785 RepID=UPI00128CCA48|nr:PhzF family phenazine biosynthesis protein [Acinetobacter portensis]MPW42272.1 phenazine biosynthesis protein PhzF [Acinetobacter portensis]